MKNLPEHFTAKSRYTDTAGVPWEGRDYTVSPFPDDTGEQLPQVTEALAAVDAGEDRFYEGLVKALRGTRVMVPITAVATDTEVTEHGLVADNASDMAVVKVKAGEDTALPIFTSSSELAQWNADARPVPMVIEQAAQAAVAEGCTMLIVDFGRMEPIVLNRSALWAIGQDKDWTPPHSDPEVQDDITQRLEGRVPHLLEVRLRPHTQRELDIVLVIEPGLNRTQLQELLADVQQRLSESEIVAEKVSSLKLTVTG